MLGGKARKDSTGRMTQPIVLSEVTSENFPSLWYELASTEHFWCEWRLWAFMGFLRGIGFPTGESLRGVEIGCGNGLVRQQMEANTAWEVDGIDIDRAALESNKNAKGETFLYNIHDRHQTLEEKYDFIILFDVLEHIDGEDVQPFLASCLYHLKPGGHFFLNVPALETLRSKYDTEVGHHRRYDKPMMRSHLSGAGLEVVGMRYWGFTLVPVALARKMVLSLKKSTEDIVRTGFEPPSKAVDSAMKTLGRIETGLFKNPPMGTSLLAAARKPS
jgi:2-polyprenyl-3-methyl-5-hydroxy-6-metoxy-1,4-benzoquinol methylase